ncbi:MAG: multidrug ABC transporter ATP-binding protein [Gammaproteobacteria bacterium]|nr:multidrug ABC transporter ATP-binding protein [Gammaproteobacteria bacterium]|tara:strand:- start:826 stop:1710 length:885 start_codon:yes stop_codon:yes gene_type:complete
MLTISGLSKTYANDVRALDDVSLTVPRGMFGLLGPNGAGKSSLMRTVATLQTPDTGRIELDGLDVLAEPDRLRRRLGYLPQEFGAYPRTSPQVMLEHIAALKGIGSRSERREVVEQLLVQTNLWDVRGKSIDTFSGGMKQRFGIAQALIGDPSLIIVDEPTAGLDPAERRRFHNLLARIGEDVVVILSTHIVEDVADLCPRMAIMGRGRILVEGAPEDLTARLDGRLWRQIVSREAAMARRAELPVVSSRLVAGRVELRVVADSAPAPDLEPATPTLEDVYFATLLEHGLSVDL